MKPFSAALEFRVLRTLAQGKESKHVGYLFSSLDEHSFHTESAKEIYNRLTTIARKRSIMLNWSDLVSDPALTEKVREKITLYRKEPLKSRKNIDLALERLNEFRQLRMLYQGASMTFTALNQEKVNTAELVEKVTEFVASARSSNDSRKWFTNFGLSGDDSGLKMIKDALNVKGDKYVPTGFTSFDKVNQGVPLGSFMLLASTTGSGKTIMISQLLENMALNGARACLVPLEMDGIDMSQRQIARRADISIGEVLKSHLWTKNQKKQVVKTMKAFFEKINKAGGSFTYFIPQDDLTAEDILFILKPYHYTVIGIDYLGLTKGHDGKEQWKTLGNATRSCKRYAVSNNNIVIAAAQLDNENKLKYSRTMEEHANLAWYWNYNKDEKAKESKIVEIEMPKTRTQTSFKMYLKANFNKMRFGNISYEEEKRIRDERSVKDQDEKDVKEKRKENKKNPYFAS
jgi:replicative DNA helicase